MSLCLLSILLIGTVSVYSRTLDSESKHWAVLVAGSNGWMNYRHQADVCHAYQILRRNGIPQERIITLMYDDIAQNQQNPTPGKIINRPDGPDVYHDVKIDYKSEDVNPDTFLKVLRGDSAGLEGVGTGRVLESGPNDHVFVNFVDHGAPGILAFGDDFLKASALHDAILQMYKTKKYAKMVIYVEACESGSIFDNGLLRKDINVFATTAANGKESSYACYMDKERETYLGDVYSVKWMEDSDSEDITTETLTKQFQITRKETNTSHVQEFGDMDMGDLDVSEFQGKHNELDPFDRVGNLKPEADAVRSEDVELNILNLKLQQAKDDVEYQKINQQLQTLRENRQKTHLTFKHIISLAVDHRMDMVDYVQTERRPLYRLECYEEVLDFLRAACPRMNLVRNEYALRHLYTMVNLCELNVPSEVILEAIEKTSQDSDKADLLC